MNKIYKTVWNALRHSLVVVNETTKSLGGQSSGSGRQQGSICAQTPARHGIQSKKCLSFKKSACLSRDPDNPARVPKSQSKPLLHRSNIFYCNFPLRYDSI